MEKTAMSINLKRLNTAQREAVETINGPLLLLAGAGTGKTTVITYRIAHMISQGIKPEKILALTFTNKAANEMKERVKNLVGNQAGLKVCLGTFHSFCLLILKKHIDKIGYEKSFSLADENLQTRILKQTVTELGVKIGEKDPFSFSEIKHYINQQKQRGKFYDKIETRLFSLKEQTYYECWRKYQMLLKEQNLLDFDDLIIFTIRLLQESSEVLQILQKQHQFLMVDEYQDTNLTQLELLRLLAGQQCNLCVVGDDDQSIYSWRGADITNILEFEKDFPNCKIIRIEENYRCSGNVLSAANKIISNNSKRYAKTLRNTGTPGENLTILEVRSENQEAEIITFLIKEKHISEQIDYENIAILFRSNSQSRLIEKELKRQEIPYKIIGSTSFYSRAEIQDAIAFLKILANPKDDNSLLRILNVPSKGLGEMTIEKLWQLRKETNLPMTKLINDERFLSQLTSNAAENCRKFAEIYKKFHQILIIEKQNLMPHCKDYLREIGYLGGMNKIYPNRKEADARLNNVYEFLNDIVDFCKKRGEIILEDYIVFFTLNDDSDKTKGEGVSLLTVHSAKGLEFENVFIIGAENEQFPHIQSITEGNIEEERRLMYVAVTRTKKHLTISWCNNRIVYGKEKKRKISCFVEEMPQELLTHHTAETILKPATTDEFDSMFANFLKD